MLRSAASLSQLALPAPHVPRPAAASTVVQLAADNNMESAAKRRRGGKGGKGQGKSALAPSSAKKTEPGDIIPAHNNDYAKVPASIKEFIKPHLNVTQANVALAKAMKVDRDAFFACFKHACRNCWAAGKGFIVHTLHACKQVNACMLECPACRANQYHWAEQCPKSK